MAIVTQPDLLPYAFAENGDYNDIPDSNDGTAGLASVSLGFPPVTEQPLVEGGLPPQRGDFNGIFRLFSQFLRYYQNGGVFEYSSTLDYQPPAVVWANNNLYKCVAENGPNTTAGVQAVTQTSYWELVSTPISVTEDSGKITITQGDSAGTSFYAAINLLQRNKSYSVGDYAYSPNIPSWAYLECTTAGTTGSTEPALPSSVNETVTDGTAVFTLYHIALQGKPVGTIHESYDSTNPGDLWGGTWETFGEGRVLVAVGSADGQSYTVGATGGSATVTLTTAQMPSHTHTATTASSGSHTHYVYGSDDDNVGTSNVEAIDLPNDNFEYTQGHPFKTSSSGSHTHTVTVSSTGSGSSHTNLQPYIAAYRFRRTA